MEKNYEPSSFEKDIYNDWLDKKYFAASINKNKTPFTIIMPPPNITSKLHIGHAFQESIQDIVIRQKRMQGYEALWLPGTDHAAIATEEKVVAKLLKEGIKKEEIGREEFSKHIEEWYATYKGVIADQFKQMGFSCDWDRLAFTMDEQNSRAVRHVFVHLFKKGYIYKGKRIINWCPACKTSISDIELEYQEDATHFWHIKYPIEGTKEYLVVATTRPETMFGDTAVAVNAKDKRYKKYIGKNVILPLVNKEIPIIADEHADMELGTGVVKITPAHDPNDYEVGLRHNLEIVSVMNDDGTMNELAGKYKGMDREVARKAVWKDLQEQGYIEKVEDLKHNVGHCGRCNTSVEPIISTQWFVKMHDLAQPAIKVVEDGTVTFNGERFKKIYLHWMKNIKDWCISRQLWSGHKIPVWVCQDCGELNCEMTDPTVCKKCGSKNLVQEVDTLDTWFSSALWPLSTLGFPDNTPDFKYFYPTNVMVTGADIIQLWVARMIFSGLEYVGDIPFKDVVINGTVKDEFGRKMSKNLGNGVDPIEMIERYGVDALRFSLFNGVSIDQDSRFSETKVELTRNFLNKIWNASLYVLHQIDGVEILPLNKVKLSQADKWILTELNKTVKNNLKKFESYDIGMAASELYDFFWNKFCDWYIEMSKTAQDKQARAAVLMYVLESTLKMLHPFIPFITEKIYLELPGHGKTIMLEKYPEYSAKNNYNKEHKFMEEIIDIIKKIRAIRSEMKIAENVKTKLFILPLKEQSAVINNAKIIEKLSNCKDVEIISDERDVKEESVTCLNVMLKAILPLSSLVDKEKEIERLTKELERIDGEIKRAEGKLTNQGFVAKAPQSLIDEEKEKVEKYKAIRTTVEQSLAKYKK